MVKRITLFLRLHCERERGMFLRYVSVCRIVIRRPGFSYAHTQRQQEREFVLFLHTVSLFIFADVSVVWYDG